MQCEVYRSYIKACINYCFILLDPEAPDNGGKPPGRQGPRGEDSPSHSRRVSLILGHFTKYVLFKSSIFNQFMPVATKNVQATWHQTFSLQGTHSCRILPRGYHQNI